MSISLNKLVMLATTALIGDGVEEVLDRAQREHVQLAEDLEHAHLADLASLSIVEGEDDVLASATDGVEVWQLLY